jgi:dTMP kinase
MRKGKFIVFEGGEGAGKTTQAKLLAAHLREFQIEVIETREPGGTPVAERIRDLVVQGRADKMGQTCEALLMYAARVDHIANVIKPALARGAWIICDRFTMSTEAYQGSAETADLLHMLEDELVFKADVEPDFTLILDIDPSVGLSRAFKRGEKSRFEEKDITFHRKIREFFREEAENGAFAGALLDVTDKDAETVRMWCNEMVAMYFGLTSEFSFEE